MQSGKHIVITALGSLGDLHPLMATALALQARGHRITFAASEIYRQRVESEGLAFHAFRPKLDLEDRQVFEEIFHPVRGPEVLMRKYIMPAVRDMYDDLAPRIAECDMLLNSTLVLAGPIAAEVYAKPWASVGLQPMLYFSAHDPPVLSPLPITEMLHRWPPAFWRPFHKLIQSVSNGWPEPVYALRRDLGLPQGKNPIFDGQFSPLLNLALFSPVLAQPQPDWPPHTHATGFVFYDRLHPEQNQLPNKVRNFIEAGEAPLVFTLGSSAVKIPGRFYEVSVAVARKLGRRAILVAGDNRPELDGDNDILLWDYVPYSQLFPHAAAIVHQGGAGTTAQALRAGKPMLIVPWGFDQPDNAFRMQRLGVSQTIPRAGYRANRVARALERLLGDAAYRRNAEQAAHRINAEDSLQNICRLVEQALATAPGS